MFLAQSSLFAGVSFAQNNRPQLHFDHLTIAEGLSHNSVYCLLQDKDGYIWIGTQNGLNKYDGYTFEIYRSGEKTDDRFRGKNITVLFEDSRGNLWVGTESQGINFKKNGTDRFENFKELPAFAEIKDFSITGFTEDKDGNIWMSVLDAGVLKYNPDTEDSKIFNTKNSDFKTDKIFDIKSDPSGKIWAAPVGTGIYFLNNNEEFELHKSTAPLQPNMDGYRKKIFPEKNNLWVATEGTGLYKMETKNDSTAFAKKQNITRYAPGKGDYNLGSNEIRDIIRASDGKIYTATDGLGLKVIDEVSGQIFNYYFDPDKADALNSNALFCLLEDRTGNIWIGTYNGGINLIKKNKIWFEHYTSGSGNPTKLERPSVLSLCQTENGNIWVGSDGGGLNLLNKNTEIPTFQKFMNDLKYPTTTIAGNVVKTIFEDSKNRLWLGCFGAGLDRFDPQTGQFEHFQLGDNIIWSIAEQKDGTLLIGTLDSGLNIFDPESKQFTKFTIKGEDPFADRNIMVVFIDDRERIWIGTGKNGLYLYDPTENDFFIFKNNPKDPTSVSNDEIRAIFQDSRGDIWIGTEGGGLNKYSANNNERGDIRFQRFQKETGLVANSIMGIAEDAEGQLWLTTFDGISRLNPKSMEIQNFNFHTGQNSNQFNQSAILADKEGKIYFGGITGLNAVHPKNVSPTEHETQVIFTDLKIFNKSIPSGKLESGKTILEKPIESAERIILDYSDNSFSIDFAALDFTNPSENIFEYKMEGFDEKWQTGDRGEHSASYTNLDPGTFIFRARRGKSQANIEVIINPPFWKTMWFRFLTFLMSAGLILGLFQFTLNRQKAKANQKLLEAETEILHLKNKHLETEVETKNSKLMFSTVQMAHKKEILTGIKQQLEKSKDNPKEMRQVKRMLNQELEGEDYWNEFNLYFEQIDKSFVKKIQKKHPKLTSNDLRLCSLIRLNLNTKEIASLLNISGRGIEQARYRLKKRLELETGEDLVKYILDF